MLIGIDASRAVSSYWGGPENYSYYLISALAKVDRKSKYILYTNTKPPRKLPQQENFSIKFINMPRLWTQVGLAWECLFHPPDILHIPAHTLPFLRRPSLKTVVTIHDLSAKYLKAFYEFPGRLYLNKSTEYCVYHATHLIAISKNTKRDLIKKFGVEEGKITVVYEGYDRKLFKPQDEDRLKKVREKYGIFKDYILSVGTVQPRKNYQRLIEAFAGIRMDPNGNSSNESECGVVGRTGLQLVIAGKKGWLCDDIYKAPQKLGIANRVAFLGHVKDSDLPALYSGALVFVFPSLYEGFGLPPLEAMACGTPVIASNTSSLPEVVGRAGLLVNPYKVAEIANAIRLVIESEALREGLKEKGFYQARKFSWEKCARETLKVFENVAGA